MSIDECVMRVSARDGFPSCMMSAPLSAGVGRENWLVDPREEVAVALMLAPEKGPPALKVKLPSGSAVTLPS